MAGKGDKLADVPVAAVRPSKTNPRSRIEEGPFEELKLSIKANGILERVLLRPVGQGYELINGERRWRAAKALGLKTIPAVVRSMSDVEAHSAQVTAFLSTAGITPLEEARAIEALRQTHGLTVEELTKRLGYGERTIQNRLALLKLPEQVQWEVNAGRLQATTAVKIASLPPKKQKRALKKIQADGKEVSHREAVEIVRQIRPPRKRLHPSKAGRTIGPQETRLAAIRKAVERMNDTREAFGIILRAVLESSPGIAPGLARVMGVKTKNSASAARKALTTWLQDRDARPLRVAAVEAALRAGGPTVIEWAATTLGIEE